MRVLALDTTTRGGSVALIEDDRIVVERPGDSTHTHAERLPNELLALLPPHGLNLSSIDLFAVAAGPGSFTGLRIGIATMQGLALVSGRRMAAISALDALADLRSQECPPGTLVAVWMDAKRGEVFSGLYSVTAAAPFTPARLVAVDGPSVDDPRATLGRWGSRLRGFTRFAGDGAVLYADLIRAHDASLAIGAPPLLAGGVGRIAVARARVGQTVHPAAVRPLYVRRPDAELIREKKGLHQADIDDTEKKPV